MSKLDCSRLYSWVKWSVVHFYQVHFGERSFATGKVTVVPFIQLCQELELP